MHVGPIEPDHEELGAEQSREGDVNGQIGHQIGVQAASARQPDCDPETEEETQSHENAVGWDIKLAVLDELGEQISE